MVLADYIQQMNSHIDRAKWGMELLPEFDWDIHIDLLGDIILAVEDIEGAREVLTQAGFNSYHENCFFYKAQTIVTLKRSCSTTRI